MELVAAGPPATTRTARRPATRSSSASPPFDAEGQPEGALAVGGDIAFTNVLISDNTDWGAGETDNTPDDIAFASWDGYFHDSLTVHASYSFDGVADFTCNADTYTCE